MASPKFPRCDERVSTVAEEVSRRVDSLSPVNQSDSNPCFHYLDSNSNSGSGFLDPEPDPNSCFIDFFNRESSFEVDRGRGSGSYDSNLLSFYRMDPDIDLGLGIGSGSGSGPVQLLDNDSVWVEADTGVTLVEEEEEEALMVVADEELEWENLQNAIYWEPEPIVQVSLFTLEEEEEELSLVSRNDEHDNLQVLLDASIVVEEEDEDDDGELMDFSFLDVDGDNDGDGDGEYGAFLFDHESVIGGSPPASKKVVEELPVVVITSEELRDGNIVCAICKDDVVVEEKVKRLPCRHYYHGECIVPWLGIRNTCPVCRYELPTDDVEYERNRRTQRRGLVADLMSE